MQTWQEVAGVELVGVVTGGSGSSHRRWYYSVENFSSGLIFINNGHFFSPKSKQNLIFSRKNGHFQASFNFFLEVSIYSASVEDERLTQFVCCLKKDARS